MMKLGKPVLNSILGWRRARERGGRLNIGGEVEVRASPLSAGQFRPPERQFWLGLEPQALDGSGLTRSQSRKSFEISH